MPIGIEADPDHESMVIRYKENNRYTPVFQY